MKDPAKGISVERDAPLDEILLGLQFDKKRFHLSPLHLGRFWAEVSDLFPVEKESKAGIRLSVNEPHEVDTRLLSTDRNWVLQPKRHSLSLAWTRQGNPDYPGFEEVKARFEEIFRKFEAFGQSIGGRNPVIVGAHISYTNTLNHLELEGPVPLTELFPNFCWSSSQVLKPPPSMNFQAEFPFPKDEGKLSVNIRYPVMRLGDQGLVPITLFQLIGVAGVKNGTETGEVFDWFDRARVFVNVAFEDLLSESVRTGYRRIRDKES